MTSLQKILEDYMESRCGDRCAASASLMAERIGSFRGGRHAVRERLDDLLWERGITYRDIRQEEAGRIVDYIDAHLEAEDGLPK
jgi:hypothetical protein